MKNVLRSRPESDVRVSRRFPARSMTMPLLVAALALCTGQLQGQNDGSGLTQQSPAPVTITPAQSNPTGNPAAPVFAPTPPAQSAGTVVTRGMGSMAPNGPLSGDGLGYGPIKPGDIVGVQIFDAPEYNLRMPVSSQGMIAIPYAGLFHIAGMTSIEAAHAIAVLFEEKEILRDPRVIVTTQQFGYNVTVMGEVRSPGIYALAGRKRLIDLLTEAGGITNNAGHVIEIFAPGSMKNPTTVLWDPTLRENDNAELEIKTGETILVSKCGVVYIGGNVGRPGAFPICESNHTTLSQIMAIAQGAKPSSSTQRTILLRSSSNGTRVVQTVKLDSILRGRQIDITMQPDDIVYVPASIWKAASKTALVTAIGFATQAYFYTR
jgi:polysaccharide biosynthesis/export protein